MRWASRMQAALGLIETWMADAQRFKILAPPTAPLNVSDDLLPHTWEFGISRTPCNTGAGFSYKPSMLELEWTRGDPKHGKVCELSSRRNQRRGAQVWLNYSKHSNGPTRAPTKEESAILSWLQCSDGQHEPIEPLTGTGRHPQVPVGCPTTTLGAMDQSHVFDLSYLVLQNACGQQPSPGRRHLLFDLGAGAYSYNYTGRLNLERASPLFGSAPLFHAIYARQCIIFHDIFAWEYKLFEPVSYWRYVPPHMKAILHFFNEPVERLESGDFNVLQVLRSAAKPDDFVAVKVDVSEGRLKLGRPAWFEPMTMSYCWFVSRRVTVRLAADRGRLRRGNRPLA